MSIAKNQKKLKKERKNSLNRFIQFSNNSKKFTIDFFKKTFFNVNIKKGALELNPLMLTILYFYG